MLNELTAVQRHLAAPLLKNGRRLSDSVRLLGRLFEGELARGRAHAVELEVRLARAYSEAERLTREVGWVLELKGRAEQSVNATRERAEAAEATVRELQAALDRIGAELGSVPFGWPLGAALPRWRRWRWRLRQRMRAGRTRRMLRRSPLFSGGWYLGRYPDVQQAGLDPSEHYMFHGAAELRDPGPGFSTCKYLARYPDVLESAINPLDHYERFGRAEGREIYQAEPPAPRLQPAEPRRRLRIVYVSGELQTPGHDFRVARWAAAAQRIGCAVTVVGIGQVAEQLGAIAASDLLVIWRAPWSDALQAAMRAARAAGAPIQYDVDDLMFEPELARVAVIDGIRSQGFQEEETAALFGRVAQAVTAADYATAPTEFLAERLQRLGKPGLVLPNGFDEAVWRNARLAVRARAAARSGDGVVRIGYAAGTRTHQRDFGLAAGAIAAVLRRRPHTRLVLFRRRGMPIIELHEFPAFDRLHDQIEWREMVSVADVVSEMARYDVSIAPVEFGNPFCEAKSELKFFEAALVEVPSVASPSGPFSDAIEHGRTGWLARDETEWTELLLGLVDDDGLRSRVGRAAYLSVLWRYGTEGRIEHLRSLLAQLFGDAAEAARAVELELYRRRYTRPAAPHLPAHRVEVLHDAKTMATVTVIVPLGDSAAQVIEALDSVYAQTLDALDLIVVHDHAAQPSAERALTWIRERTARFGRAVMVRNDEPSGRGLSRNVGFAYAETPFVVPLDPDDTLLPNFCAKCVAVAERTTAAFVYPMTRDSQKDEGATWHLGAARLAAGDGMAGVALLRLAAWAEVGGYSPAMAGGNRPDLWRRFAERGLFGEHLPEVLAVSRRQDRQPSPGS